jgi:hypothetical protein
MLLLAVLVGLSVWVSSLARPRDSQRLLAKDGVQHGWMPIRISSAATLNRQPDGEEDNTETTTGGEHSCSYRSYPDPKHHEGLPFLAEVFAVNSSVYFVAMNKGGCLEEWRHAQEFHSTPEKKHYFQCRFPDGTTTTSDPIHHKNGDDEDWSNAVFIIRCDLPTQYQSWVALPATTTNLTVTLLATEDLEESSEIEGAGQLGSFPNLPVCHSERPAYNNTIISRTEKNYVSMMTKIKSHYTTHEVHERKEVTIDPILVISWIEHHLLVGFEHFYIFDNDPEPHGMLEKTLMPYIDSGVVTYIWYPLEDCTVDYRTKKKWVGERFTISQGAANMGALRRYEHLTTYMGHFDIDEYIVLPECVSNIQSLIREKEKYDSLNIRPTWFGECEDQSSTTTPSQDEGGLSLPFENYQCSSYDRTPPKSIMRTDRILAVFVHIPTASVDLKPLRMHHICDVTLAHFRKRRGRDEIDPTFTYVHDVRKRYRNAMVDRIGAYQQLLQATENESKA